MLQHSSTPNRKPNTRITCLACNPTPPAGARSNAPLKRSGACYQFELNPQRLGAALLRHHAEIRSLPLCELSPSIDLDAAAMYVLRSWPAWLKLLKPRGLSIDRTGRRYWRIPSVAEAALRANALYLVARDSLTEAAVLRAAETRRTQATTLLNTLYEDLRQRNLEHRRAQSVDPCPLALCDITSTTEAVSLDLT